MASQPRVTLREIAERTGVTRMAVSLALRGKAGVSAVTRKKVLKTARELGYVPDPEIANLMARIRRPASAGANACLALLTSGAVREDWRRSVTERKYVEGARARAGEYGYHVEEFWVSEPGMTGRRLGDIIWNRGIEGVIIAPLQERLSERTPRSVQLDFNRFAAVEIGETVERPNLNRSIHDQYTSMLTLLGELAGLGCVSIGLVIEESLDMRVNGKWTAAYLRYGHQMRAKRLPPPLIMAGPKQSTFDRWFDRYRPDAIVSVDRFGLRLLEQRGLRMPDDVNYATLDRDGIDAAHGDVSGIDQNSRLVGAAAVDVLVAAMQRGQRGIPNHPLRIQIEGTWKPGRSTIPRPCRDHDQADPGRNRE